MDYSYTLSIPSGSNYLKVVNKNPQYFPDNFRIHDLGFGEPPKGVIPVTPVEPPNLIQSMSGDIIVYNGTTSSIDVTNVYMSASIYQQNAFMAPTVSIAPDSASAFVIQSLGISANPIEFPDQIEVVIEVNGDIVSSVTGSWIDINTSTDIYDGYYSGSYFTGGKTYSKFIFDTKTTFTTESQVYISGQSTL